MVKRYTINSEFVFEDCLVTPSVYEGVLQRFDEFVTPFISHIHTQSQQQKARDYMKGLLSDTERKNIESISYFHGYDRQRLQIFIGQTDWDDEAILNKLAAQITDEIVEEDGLLILNPTSFPKKGNESVALKELLQRQWCGRLGKTENCQVATFLAYASSIGDHRSGYVRPGGGDTIGPHVSSAAAQVSSHTKARRHRKWKNGRTITPWMPTAVRPIR